MGMMVSLSLRVLLWMLRIKGDVREGGEEEEVVKSVRTRK